MKINPESCDRRLKRFRPKSDKPLVADYQDPLYHIRGSCMRYTEQSLYDAFKVRVVEPISSEEFFEKLKLKNSKYYSTPELITLITEQ